MHLVHIVPAVTIGGLWRSLQATARLQKRGFRLTILTIFDLDQVDILRNMSCKLVQLSTPLNDLDRRHHISNLVHSVLDQLRPDIVQSHHLYSDIYALPAARTARVRAIRMVHGITQATRLSPLHRQEVKKEWTEDEIGMELSLEDVCLGTLAVSRELRTRLVRYGLDKDKIGVLYPGVDVDELRRLVPAASSKRSRVTIGFVGRLEIVKNPMILPYVAHELAKGGHSAQFLIIGDGRERQNLIAILAELGESNRFTILPLTTDIYPLYSMIDILIIPSISEGLPLVLLEAMALGIPVVAANVGGIPEVVTDGINGFLCQPGDVSDFSTKLAHLIENRGLRESLGSAGRDTVDQGFSINKHLQALERFYLMVMEGVPVGTISAL